MTKSANLTDAKTIASEWDRETWRGPIAVLLTATTPEPLAPYLDLSALPHFAAGPHWTVQQDTAIENIDCYDFAVVLCAQADQVSSSAALAQYLRERGLTTLMLAPARLEPCLPTTAEFLSVVGPNDKGAGLRALCDILLAGIQQDGLVGCDWVDISSTLKDGARGELCWSEGRDVGEAVHNLTQRLAPLATGLGYGAIGAVTINSTGHLRDWTDLLHLLKSTARAEAWSIASAPYCDGECVRASALLLTMPSTRYARNLVAFDQSI